MFEKSILSKKYLWTETVAVKIQSQLTDLSHDECEELCKAFNTVIAILSREEI